MAETVWQWFLLGWFPYNDPSGKSWQNRRRDARSGRVPGWGIRWRRRDLGRFRTDSARIRHRKCCFAIFQNCLTLIHDRLKFIPAVATCGTWATGAFEKTENLNFGAQAWPKLFDNDSCWIRCIYRTHIKSHLLQIRIDRLYNTLIYKLGKLGYMGYTDVRETI